jgi:hypothetical protein
VFIHTKAFLSVNFERFTGGKLSYIPVNVKLWESPGRAGGLPFINYFNRFGCQWQVYIQAEGDYRTEAENVGQFYVRNNRNEMVPLSTLTQFDPRPGP